MRPPLPLLLCISSPQATTSSHSTITALQLAPVQFLTQTLHNWPDKDYYWKDNKNFMTTF